MFPQPIETRRPTLQIAYRGAVWLMMFVWILPLIAIVMTAIRPQADLLTGNYWSLPSTFAFFDNVSEVLQNSNMIQFFRNSIVITSVTVVLVLMLSTMSAMALAKYRIPGQAILFAIFVGGNFIPHQILMVPVRNLILSLGLYDTVWGLILFHTAFQVGFGTLIMRNFIVNLPNELIESARIDGANEFRIITKIVIPLLRPALAGLAVLTFTFVWNEYFWALVLVQSDQAKPLTLGIAGLKGEWLTAWNLICSASLFAALPPVLMFFLMQKHFVAGLTSGAVKA